MKLSKIYSNNDAVFEPIEFRPDLNVICAKVHRKKDQKKDSHNLGKTLLISLIDFMLLSKLKEGHFLHDKKELFRDFIFFLEIKTNDGSYMTIKRSVLENTKISFKLHPDNHQDFSKLTDSQWDENKMPFEKAKKFLNDKLNLSFIKEWNYRKGITYFLRDQRDWADAFMIEKFLRNEHIYWKPYLARVLGFDDKLIQGKYELDEKINEIQNLKKTHQKILSVDPNEYDKIKGHIEIRQTEMDKLKRRGNKFNFFKDEIYNNKILVEEIETNVTRLNELLYNINFEIERINESLKDNPEFNFDGIKDIFKEIDLYFPKKLLKDFSDLQNFNKKITLDRSARLKNRLELLLKQKEERMHDLEEFNKKREEKLAFLREHDTFKKYKSMQSTIVSIQSDIVNLENQLKNLNMISSYDEKIGKINEEIDVILTNLKRQIRVGNETFKKIRLIFDEIIKNILNLNALISVKINNVGNLDFDCGIISVNDNQRMTMEGEGTSYKKLLCATFDLAVLQAHINDNFFRFVYHDGILEGLDDRKKITFLKTVRNIIEKCGIQYILTVIDSDLPRDENDKKIDFENEYVVKELHDEGDDGRLFKMPSF